MAEHNDLMAEVRARYKDLIEYRAKVKRTEEVLERDFNEAVDELSAHVESILGVTE